MTCGVVAAVSAGGKTVGTVFLGVGVALATVAFRLGIPAVRQERAGHPARMRTIVVMALCTVLGGLSLGIALVAFGISLPANAGD
jgi:hypothetical protein